MHPFPSLLPLFYRYHPTIASVAYRTVRYSVLFDIVQTCCSFPPYRTVPGAGGKDPPKSVFLQSNTVSIIFRFFLKQNPGFGSGLANELNRDEETSHPKHR